MEKKYTQTKLQETIAYLELQQPPLNSLDIPFMQELIEVHRSLAQEKEVKAVILSSTSPNFFCNGLDPENILAQNLEGRKFIFKTFLEMVEEIYAFPKIHISVINGHAMAGGAILALLSDFRFMNSERGRISFSEVSIGLTIPTLILEIMSLVIATPHLTKATMLSKAFKGQEALEIGLVDNLYPPEELFENAEKETKKILTLYLPSMIDVKLNWRKTLLYKMPKEREIALSKVDSFLSGENFENSLKKIIAINPK